MPDKFPYNRVATSLWHPPPDLETAVQRKYTFYKLLLAYILHDDKSFLLDWLNPLKESKPNGLPYQGSATLFIVIIVTDFVAY